MVNSAVLDLLPADVPHDRRMLTEQGTAASEPSLINHSPIELVAYHRALEQGSLALRVQLMVGADLRPTGRRTP